MMKVYYKVIFGIASDDYEKICGHRCFSDHSRTKLSTNKIATFSYFFFAPDLQRIRFLVSSNREIFNKNPYLFIVVGKQIFFFFAD
jgi:hypothetical protein